LRRARLEQLGHTWQTAGDVARLRRFLRNAREHLAHADILSVAHGDDRTDLEGDIHRLLRTRHFDVVAGLVGQLHLWTQTLGLLNATSPALRIDDAQRGKTGYLVDLPHDGYAFLDVLEPDSACVLGNDRSRVRIPRRQHLARFHAFSVTRQQRCPVRHLVALALSVVFVMDHDLAIARDHDQFATRIRDVTHAGAVMNRAIRLAFD